MLLGELSEVAQVVRNELAFSCPQIHHSSRIAPTRGRPEKQEEPDPDIAQHSSPQARRILQVPSGDQAVNKLDEILNHDTRSLEVEEFQRAGHLPIHAIRPLSDSMQEARHEERDEDLGVCVWWGVALEHEPFVDGVAGGLCEDFAGCLMPRVPVRTVSGGLENGG